MTAREARTVRWGAVGVGLILGYVLLLDPYLAARAQGHTAIEEREAQLARLLSLERSLPTSQRELAQARETWRQQVAPRLLAAGLPAVAASRLSEEVRRIAAQSFLEVERENQLPAGDEDGLTSVPVQFSLRGDIYGLRDFLSALEASESFLHLRELRVTSVTGGLGPVRGGAPLQITVTLEGYLAGEGGPGAAATEAIPAAAGGAAATAPRGGPRGGRAPGAAADFEGEGVPDGGLEAEEPRYEPEAELKELTPEERGPAANVGAGVGAGVQTLPDVDGDGVPDAGFRPRPGPRPGESGVAPGTRPAPGRPAPGIRRRLGIPSAPRTNLPVPTGPPPTTPGRPATPGAVIPEQTNTDTAGSAAGLDQEVR